MSHLETREIYDDIVDDYCYAESTIVLKQEYVMPRFWDTTGDISGLKVLDLACASGKYTRELKNRGAGDVTGVDISKEMIKEALKVESDAPLGINYYAEDASKFNPPDAFDLVLALYLLTYAESKEKLMNFCDNIFKSTRSGGRFVTVTNFWDPQKARYQDAHRENLGYEMNHKNNFEDFCDGDPVTITLHGKDKKSTCSFPNHLWKFETVKESLRASGFSVVEGSQVLPDVPIIIIEAKKEDF